MLDHAITFENPIENSQGTAAIHHEIFRNDFKPIDDGGVFEDVPIVGNAQANADSKLGIGVKSVGRHKEKNGGREGGAQPRGECYDFFFIEPSVAQPPLPLQEFLALHPLSLLLQPPLPLQEFLPLQACFSTSAKPVDWPSATAADIL